MDEPFASVDADTRSVLQDELLGIWRATGKTVLFVSLEVEDAVTLADYVMVFEVEDAVTLADCVMVPTGSPVRLPKSWMWNSLARVTASPIHSSRSRNGSGASSLRPDRFGPAVAATNNPVINRRRAVVSPESGSR